MTVARIPTPTRPMLVAGIMSGTSADGIDVALVEIAPKGQTAKNRFPKLRLVAHEAFPYAAGLRKAVLAAMNATTISTAELARLNWRLGLAYAEAVRQTLIRHRVQLDLIGCHGQTLFHQSAKQAYLGAKFACTWQLGEASILAGKLGVPVVSNFRPADMVANGQGAPLVPLLDFVLFRDEKRGRVLQNIGGIANLTAIPPNANESETLAFDCGPGNMLIDALMLELYNKPMDLNGAIAATGKVLEKSLSKALRHAFFRKQPPKTAGREQFGREFAAELLGDCQRESKRKQDAIATATALTAISIVDSYLRFAGLHMKGAAVDYIVSGGGARNATLMEQLTERLRPHQCHLATIDKFGLPAEAKEASAFALLAWQTWHRLPGNMISATGASRPAILGQVTYV